MAIRKQSVRVKSTLARAQAEVFAMAASMQLITSKVAGNVYAGEWFLTVAGQKWLNQTEE